MDTQGSTGASFIEDVEHLTERVGEGLKDDAETIADRVFGKGTSAEVETLAAAVVTKADNVAGAAVATLTALGAAHVNIGQIGAVLTAELSAVKTSIEDNIIALARHIAGTANG